MPLQAVDDVHFHSRVIDGMLDVVDLRHPVRPSEPAVRRPMVPDVELIQREVFDFQRGGTTASMNTRRRTIFVALDVTETELPAQAESVGTVERL